MCGHPKPRPRLLDKRQRMSQRLAAWRELSARIRERDNRRCRVCGGPGYEGHHIEMRSRGGKDVDSNVVLLCHACHREVHGHVLKLFGTATDLRWERVA